MSCSIVLASLQSSFTMPFMNSNFENPTLFAICAFIIAYLLREKLPHSNSIWAQQYAGLEDQLAAPFYLYGFAMILFATYFQWWGMINYSYESANINDMWISSLELRIILSALTYLGFSFLSSVWGERITAVAHTPLVVNTVALSLATFILLIENQPLLSSYKWIFWPVALLLQLTALNKMEQFSSVSKSILHTNHAILVWILAIVIGQTLFLELRASSLANTSWVTVIQLASASIFLFILTAWSGNATLNNYPLETQRDAYLVTAAAPIAIILAFCAVVVALGSPGDTEPLPYIPLLNPIELSIFFALFTLVFWQNKLKENTFDSAPENIIHQINIMPILIGIGFLMINMTWLRTAHHFFIIEWMADALFESYVVQTGYAILWTLIALITMVWAHRTSRTIWIIGASLLGLTILKLAIIDFANHDGLERIIAFIGVGVMMLIIGYLAPLPPKEEN